MPTFERGDVVKVPFPYTDRHTRQFRPALIVSGSEATVEKGLVWVLMITSAENRGWAGDIAIRNLEAAGLPAPSVIRTAKIATIDARDAAKLGKVGKSMLAQVLQRLTVQLGIAPSSA